MSQASLGHLDVGGKFFSATEGQVIFDDTRFSALAMRLGTPVFENDTGDARVVAPD